jgi:uncharacterized membrane protein
MTTTHFILRYAHISMAMVGLVSGAAAMTLRKGSPLHRQAGNVFFISMLTMSAAGATIAAFIVPVAANVMGGLMAFYLTATAWATVWRKPGETGRLEIALAFLGLATAILGINFGIQAANSPNGTLHQFPATGYFVFGGGALLGTALDVRMIFRGGFSGTSRLTRHLSRMCFAFFMATGSFFLGQAKLFPAEVRESGVLPVLGFLPLGLMIYWLVRVRVWPRIRRVRGLRPAQSFPGA